MTRKWLRFRDLKARGLVDNRMTLKRWIDNYGFPPGTLIGPNTRAWTEEEIEQYEAERQRTSAETEAA